jgi:hypothetical protein
MDESAPNWQIECRTDVMNGALALVGNLTDYVASLETSLVLERAKVAALQARLAAVEEIDMAVVAVTTAVGG